MSLLDPRRTPIMATTQDAMEVVDILGDLLFTKNGTICLVIKTSSVNFDLLAEDEQDIKIQAFASLVNSLDFQMQVLIETRKVNISDYLDYLNALDTPDLSPGLKRQFTIYKAFIGNLITKKEILDKRFFIVIPYRSAIALSVRTPMPQKQKLFELATSYLYPKKYHIIKMLKGIGLDGEQLTSKELTRYFFTTFNPEAPLVLDGINLRI